MHLPDFADQFAYWGNKLFALFYFLLPLDLGVRGTPYIIIQSDPWRHGRGRIVL